MHNTVMDNTSTLGAAINGHRTEHGFDPDLVAMTADVAKAIIQECAQNSRYKGIIDIGGDSAPMRMFGIEVAQLQGVNTVKLMSDLTTARALKTLRG